MATLSSILAWKIPWMEEPGRLQSMGSLGRAEVILAVLCAALGDVPVDICVHWKMGIQKRGLCWGHAPGGLGGWKQPPRKRARGREPGPPLKSLRCQPGVQGSREAENPGSQTGWCFKNKR